MAYRETVDRLGLEEREGEAVRVLGRWRDAVRTRVLLGAALCGVLAAAGGFYFAIQLQLEVGEIASARLGALVAAAAFVSTLLAGRTIAKLVIQRRIGGLVTQLAEDYEVPRERLAELAQMIERL